MEYRVGTITKNGVGVPIEVDDHGNWSADHGGQYLTADTRDQLERKIERATKKTQTSVSVPFVRLDRIHGGGLLVSRGTATGIHSSNGNVLVTWDDGSKGQLVRWGGNVELWAKGDVSQGELGELVLRYEEMVRAREAYSRISRELSFDLKSAVEKALEAAVDPGKEEKDG